VLGEIRMMIETKREKPRSKKSMKTQKKNNLHVWLERTITADGE
jgi:hypothetical protein